MAGSDTRIHVGGDLLGQLVIGDHNVTVWAEQSVVTVLPPGERPTPRRRATVGLLPAPGSPMLGRERELAEVTNDDALAQVYGPPGIGKSTLLRHAARRLADRGASVVFLPGAGREAEDLLQDVFEACYEAAGYHPSPVEMRHLLADADIRLVVDDLGLVGDDRDELRDGIPAAKILFSSAERSVWVEGRAVGLAGLADDAATRVLELAIGRPLHAAEHPVAGELTRAAGGSPLLLLRAAKAAQSANGALPRPADLAELQPRVLAGLDPAALDAVLALGAARGPVSAAALSWLVGDPGSLPPALARLVRLGVVLDTGYGHALAPGVDAVVSGWPADARQVEWWAGRLATWARSAGVAAAEVAAHAVPIGGVIDASIAAGRPDLGARLARSVAPIVACSARTGAWGLVLDRGAVAARLAGDRATLAYLTHEEGVRRLVTGRRVAAAAAVGVAVALWHELGDGAHLGFALHNQSIVGHATAAHAAVHTATGATNATVNAANATVPAGAHAAADPTTIHAAAQPAGHAIAGHAGAAAKTGGITAKVGLGLGAKLAVAGAVTAVAVTGAVVAVTVATSHSTAPAAGARPTTISGPPTAKVADAPLSGPGLYKILLPDNAFPAGFGRAYETGGAADGLTTPDADTGRDLLPVPASRAPIRVDCRELVDIGGGSGVYIPLTSAGDITAGAVGEVGSEDLHNYFMQEVFQYPSAAAASAAAAEFRTLFQGCRASIFQRVDVKDVHVGDDPATEIATAPNSGAPGWMTPAEFILVRDGARLGVLSASTDGPTPPPHATELPELAGKLVARLRGAAPTGRAPATVPNAPAPNPAVASPQARIVEIYYAALANGASLTAWQIGGQQYNGTQYPVEPDFEGAVHGIADEKVTVLSVQGDTVTADVTTTYANGTHATFHGVYAIVERYINTMTVKRTSGR